MPINREVEGIRLDWRREEDGTVDVYVGVRGEITDTDEGTAADRSFFFKRSDLSGQALVDFDTFTAGVLGMVSTAIGGKPIDYPQDSP